MSVSMHARKIQNVRRTQEETRITHSQHQTRPATCQRRMPKVQCIAVEVLPVIVINQRFELLELGSAGIRSQNLEIRESRIQVDRKTDQLFDTGLRVLKKTNHVKRRGSDSQLPTQLDHATHVLVRNETPGYLFEDKRIGRLDAEVDRPQTRSMHFSNQFLIQIIHP